MKRVLVLGGGQLGLMLAGAAARLGITLDRLDPEQRVLIRGTARATEALPSGWTAADYDLLTAEREHLPDDEFTACLRRHPGFGANAAIATLADRRTQKALLDRLDIPTATWAEPREPGDVERFAAEHGGRAILKAARGGYDGRGQWTVRPGASLPDPRAVDGGLIVERCVAFARELSLVGARLADGRCVFYPLVENHHADGMLRCTVAPAAAEQACQRQAEQMLGAVMEALGYVGVMAMELFEEDGALLVNELAPRVHNSGHWTQAGAVVDQFELHLRALCGLPCPAFPPARPTVMLNLVGVDFDPDWLAVPRASLHWYGKSPAPGRKLGHLNLCASETGEIERDLQALLSRLDEAHALAARHALARLRASATPSACTRAAGQRQSAPGTSDAAPRWKVAMSK